MQAGNQAREALVDAETEASEVEEARQQLAADPIAWAVRQLRAGGTHEVNRVISDAGMLRLQKAIVTGPFQLVCTTNWDLALEAAYAHLRDTGGDVARPHATARFLHSAARQMPVYYRKDIRRLFAELRAGRTRPRLFKMHGDIGAGGDEFVGGHSDYRKVMIRDVAGMHLLRYLCSNHSILFYGHSLTDKDLLATFDDMIESFG